LTRLLKLSLQKEIDNGLQMDNSNASESVSLPQRTTEQEGLTSYNEDNGQDVDAHSLAIPESTNRSSAAANNSAQFQIPSAQVSETTSSFTATRSRHSAGRTEGIGILPSTPHLENNSNETHGDSASDFIWPPIGYGGQLNQVDSQLDEVFGAFGQSELQFFISVSTLFPFLTISLLSTHDRISRFSVLTG
jgi:hypothetical protein